MSPNYLKAMGVLLCVGLVSFLQAPAAHGFAAYTITSSGYGFSNLGTNPNQFASWDPDTPGGSVSTLTYRFDSSFTNDNRIRDQVRLAFDQWDFAWFTDDGATYSYLRNSGTQPFGDIRSIAVHEIGHALVYHHPDVGDDISRNYGLNTSPPPPLVTQSDQNNELMRSWIPAGAYNQVLSHDELDGYEHFYPTGTPGVLRNLNFTEITSGTPDILISAGPETFSTTWAATRPAGVQRDPSDVTQGWRLTSAPINFNSTSSTPMGFRTLGINWDYQNPSATKATREFEVVTRGTSNTDAVFHYDGSAARHFNTYTTTSTYDDDHKDDLLHKWSNPDPGDFSPSDIIHVGVEQDVWDWTVVSAQVVHPDGTKSDAPLLGMHDWNQTVTGVFSSSEPSMASESDGIHMGPPVQIIAEGIQFVAPRSSPVEVLGIGLALVEDMDLGLADLNRETMNRLQEAKRLETLDIQPMTLDNGALMTLVLDGDPFEPANPVFVEDGARWLNQGDLFVAVMSRDPRTGALGGTYGLLQTEPITGVLVPEPGTWAMLLGAGLIGLLAYGRRRRRQSLRA